MVTQNWIFDHRLYFKACVHRVEKIIKATYLKFAGMWWALAEPGGEGPMDGGWIIRQVVGGRINIRACDYISSVE